jgi:hypothetical protein
VIRVWAWVAAFRRRQSPGPRPMGRSVAPWTKRDTRASNGADQATAHVQRRDPDVLYRPDPIGSRAPAVSDVILRIASQTTERAASTPGAVDSPAVATHGEQRRSRDGALPLSGERSSGLVPAAARNRTVESHGDQQRPRRDCSPTDAGARTEPIVQPRTPGPRPLRASAATPVRCRYRCGSSSAGQRRRSTSGSARSNSGSSAPRTRRSESCSTTAGCAGSATVSPSTGSSATSSASPTRARCRGAQLVPHEATPRETRADHHSHAVCVEHGDAFIGETAARDVERMS